MPPPKTLDEMIKESIRCDAPFQHFATVIISDRNIIQGITQSKRNNLILDNFGIILAGLIRAPVNANTLSANYKDSAGGSDKCNIYRTGSSGAEFNEGDGAGFNLQVGAGATAATRADYVIETAFGTAPEDDVFPTGNGSYAAGAVSLSGAISAGGNGTIAECGMYMLLQDDTAVLENVMFFHDILASTEAFVAAQTITVAYTINL